MLDALTPAPREPASAPDPDAREAHHEPGGELTAIEEEVARLLAEQASELDPPAESQ